MPAIDLRLNRKLFNDAYFPYLLDFSKRYEVYIGGAGSGKSVALAQKIIIKACNDKRKVLVIRKFGTTLKDSVFALVIDILKQWQLYPICKINLSTFTITLPNGSVILFKGMDDSEKIKSITAITDIWVEEATEISSDEFDQLDLRLRADVDDLNMFVSFNPVSKANWVFKKWFENPEAVNKENTRILRTTYRDNRFLPQPYIEALEEKQRTNPNYYKVYALGEFCSLDKLVLTNWRVEDFDAYALSSSGLEIHAGCDLGFIDDTAIIGSLYDEKNHKIYIYDEFCRPGCQLSFIADKIIEMKLNKVPLYVDSAEPRSIAFFREKHINAQPCKKGGDSVSAGFDFLKDNEIIVSPNCVKVISDLGELAYIKDKNGEYKGDMGPHSASHTLDALRYAYSYIYTNHKLKSFNKSLLGL